MKRQRVDGKPVYVIVLPENPQTILPITSGWNPMDRNISKVVDEAIRTGVVTEGGKYGFDYIKIDGRLIWNVYRIIE